MVDLTTKGCSDWLAHEHIDLNFAIWGPPSALIQKSFVHIVAILEITNFTHHFRYLYELHRRCYCSELYGIWRSNT